jgi:hypothetical protein
VKKILEQQTFAAGKQYDAAKNIQKEVVYE